MLYCTCMRRQSPCCLGEAHGLQRTFRKRPSGHPQGGEDVPAVKRAGCGGRQNPSCLRGQSLSFTPRRLSLRKAQGLTDRALCHTCGRGPFEIVFDSLTEPVRCQGHLFHFLREMSSSSLFLCSNVSPEGLEISPEAVVPDKAGQARLRPALEQQGASLITEWDREGCHLPHLCVAGTAATIYTDVIGIPQTMPNVLHAPESKSPLHRPG